MAIIRVSAKLEERNIDLNALDVGISEVFLKSVGNIAYAAKGEWEIVASRRLKTSRQEYIQGLQKADSFTTKIIGTQTIFEIMLVGDMPNNFEFGMPSYDMKAVRPGWLGGGKAKTSADGTKYITIPFRHSLTSAANLEYTGKAKRENLREELAKTVQKFGLNQMIRASTGKVMTGPVRRVPNRPDVHPYLRGLTRIQQTAEGLTPSGKTRGQSYLMTWRTMSEKSAPDAWIHPGIKGVNIMPEIENWIDNELNGLVDKMFGVA